MDRYLISGAILLLFFEVAWFLNDFKIIHIPAFDRSEFAATKPAVGKIAEIKKGVRRRAHDSIVWEDSSEKDVLYNFDSVLTLPQSSAKVALANDTKIVMSENTLILIENNQDMGNSKVRLRFAKGDVRTLGSTSPTEIATEEWTVDAEAGAELNLRQVEGGKVEVEVVKGEASLKGATSQKTISRGQVLALIKDKIVEEKIIAQETKWLTRDGLRIYTFDLPMPIDLEWEGEADTLWHLLPDRKVQTQKISGSERKKSIALSSGSHSLRLEKNGAISKTIQISVWEAPVVHLLSPLPRDRVRPGEEVSFSWNPTKLASNYKLQFSDKADFSNIVSETPVDPSYVKLNLKREGAFHWRIIGVDDMGFLLPPLYSNPIYNYRDLLDAPIIKPTKARQPAQESKDFPDGAWLWNLFITPVFAAELYDVIFEWEPVAGAEHYMIEVDNDGTFRKPITLVKSDSSKFVWTRAPLGKYYWRVAAGRGTTMGRFSPPQLIDLAKVLRDSRVGEEQGISIKPVDPPVVEPPLPMPQPSIPVKIAAKPKSISKQKSTPPQPPPPLAKLEAPLSPPPVAKVEERPIPKKVELSPPKKVEPPAPETKSLPAPEVKREPPFIRTYNFDLYGGAGYDQKTLGVPSDLTVKLANFLTPVIGGSVKASLRNSGSLVFATQLTSNSWKSKTPEDYPAQKEITERNWRNQILWQMGSPHWSFGAAVNSIGLLERDGLVDQVKFSAQTMLGVGVRYSWGTFTHDFTWTSDFSDRSAMEIGFGTDYKKSFAKWNVHVLGNIFSRSGKNESSSFGIYIAPALGIEW